MLNLIRWEIKKSLRTGLLLTWALGLVLAYVATRVEFGTNEAYADIFSKYYGLFPIMGFIMCILFTQSFIFEYSSNVDGLIKSSKNGRNNIILSKFIANGIVASIINLSILLIMVIKAMMMYQFDGMNLQLQSLWYFGNSGSTTTVLQMLLILMITVPIGSFLFAAIGLYISSVNKSATIPFIIIGIVIAIPYVLPKFISTKIGVYSPAYGMYSQQLIRYAAPISAWIVFIARATILGTIFYNLNKRAFLK